MFLIGKSGLCIFHRHFFADRMHNWLFPLFLLGIFILLHSKIYRLVGIFFELNIEELSEYGMKTQGNISV